MIVFAIGVVFGIGHNSWWAVLYPFGFALFVAAEMSIVGAGNVLIATAVGAVGTGVGIAIRRVWERRRREANS